MVRLQKREMIKEQTGSQTGRSYFKLPRASPLEASTTGGVTVWTQATTLGFDFCFCLPVRPSHPMPKYSRLQIRYGNRADTISWWGRDVFVHTALTTTPGTQWAQDQPLTLRLLFSNRKTRHVLRRLQDTVIQCLTQDSGMVTFGLTAGNNVQQMESARFGFTGMLFTRSACMSDTDAGLPGR